ncbi:MAG: TadE family protein, partial [Actinomycetes bacterium]
MRVFRLRGRRDDGASAVEFALVAPILLMILFGILEYGLWFSDSLSMRQGVREAARQGVVANFGTAGCTLVGSTGASANIQGLMCTTKDRIGGITGQP